MKSEKTNLRCPYCGDLMALTTEWGWIDKDTCTATLACPYCRTDSEHADDAVWMHHEASRGRDDESTETAALQSLLDDSEVQSLLDDSEEENE